MFKDAEQDLSQIPADVYDAKFNQKYADPNSKGGSIAFNKGEKACNYGHHRFWSDVYTRQSNM